MNIQQEFEDLLGRYAEDWPDVDRALALDVAADYAVLLARKTAGEDVDEALNTVTTQVRGIQAAKTYSAAHLLSKSVENWAARAVRIAAAGLLA